ncbi:MAG: 23S rRNA (guanosine(2251)-2'-O)-methyltransferase RlmB [Deltaproteobacteria bacterium]|nr:MAG: 23S rRNA (guanosine(2251)-2'-O)-methyltransferase RlmB [Deltaproteobacteria bacterium]
MKEWLYGRRTVAEHLKSLPETCERLLVAKGARLDEAILIAAEEAGVSVEQVERSKLDSLSAGGNHQGICLRVGGWKYADMEELTAGLFNADGFPAIFVLDSIQDPRNLGAVIRVADGVGAAGVVIAKDRSAALSASVARSAAGALANVKVAQVVNISRTLVELKREGIFVAGTAMEGELVYSAPLTFPLALVLGAEGKGLRPNVASKCDILLSLPMEGGVQSLNVSVAAGVFGYESWRRFKGL